MATTLKTKHGDVTFESVELLAEHFAATVKALKNVNKEAGISMSDIDNKKKKHKISLDILDNFIATMSADELKAFTEKYSTMEIKGPTVNEYFKELEQSAPAGMSDEEIRQTSSEYASNGDWNFNENRHWNIRREAFEAGLRFKASSAPPSGEWVKRQELMDLFAKHSKSTEP